MKVLIKKNLRRAISKFRRITNHFGSDRKCYICKREFNHFTKYRGGSKRLPEFRKRLNIVGSDVDNFGCMYCGSHDRERHLYMFFDKLELWERMKDAKLLHFAAEKNLQIKINEQFPVEYVRADLYPMNDSVKKIDATKIPFDAESFDIIIANHILEHIPDYSKALTEFYRVLKPGGIAILQTPYSKLLKNNFEDVNINNDELRLFFHGLEGHVRTFGESQFLESIEDVGFNLKVIRHEDLFDDKMSYTYGVNKKEDLIQAVKQKTNSV